MPNHVLLVDDDMLLRRSLAFNLQQAGYRVSTAANAEDALALAQRDRADLVLLDLGLPGMQGMQALFEFRRMADIPVIFLTARAGQRDQVIGLEMGADDYVTKPFDVDVLLARTRAVLRRAQHPAGAVQPMVRVGNLMIDPGAHVVTLAGRPVNLPPREFSLLYALALQAGRVISTEQLLAQVWGAEYQGEPQVIYVHMRWLRELLEEDPNHPRLILSVRGVGYKLEAHADDV